jgi:hypothetical protein
MLLSSGVLAKTVVRPSGPQPPGTVVEKTTVVIVV